MAKSTIDITSLNQHMGQPLGTSRWLEINQSRVTKFAEATGDFNWIHVDQERARTELASGRTLVQNFLLLSLIPQLFDQTVAFSGLRYGQNKGARKLNFLAPLATGSRVRLRVSLAKIDQDETGGQLVTFPLILEEDGSDCPVLNLDLRLLLVAEQRVRLRISSADQHQAVAL
ncbi:MAG: dehydratase [Alphaproteobacteria bacterium]|nr:MAG: dehydratase [Alphaproteobacteria bacterium]